MTTKPELVRWGWRVGRTDEAQSADSHEAAMLAARAAAVAERDAGREPFAYICWRMTGTDWTNDTIACAGLPVLFEHHTSNGGLRVLKKTDGSLSFDVVESDSSDSLSSIPLTRSTARALCDALAGWLDGPR